MESIEIQNELRQYEEETIPRIEDALKNFLPTSSDNVEARLDDSIRRFVSSDQQRLPALLVLLSAEIVGETLENALPVAAAVEFLGASARAFTSALENIQGDGSESHSGILSGVSLLNAAYDSVFVKHSVLPERAMRAHAEIVECVGTSGIFGNTNERRPDGEADPSRGGVSGINSEALIRLSVRLGAVLAGANYLELDALSRFAGNFSGALSAKDSLEADLRRGSISEAGGRLRIKDSADQAKLILIENFPSSHARSVFIQLVDQLTGE